MARKANRKLRWVEQARRVIEFALPADYVDRNCPDLAKIKNAMLMIGFFMLESPRRGRHIPILDGRRTVRVRFSADRLEVVGYVVEASYDGGETFVDPLSRYGDVRPRTEQPDM